MYQSGEFDIVGALTTVNDTFGRVSMHGLRTELLLAQVEAGEARRPCWCTFRIRARTRSMKPRWRGMVEAAKQRGVTHIIFGDLFLQDIRAYREEKLAGTGITPVFPLWLQADGCARGEMIAGGVEAYLATVDPKKVSAGFAGRRFDRDLLRELPAGIDPCGENGEFHSFVAAGPMLSRRIPVRSARRSSARVCLCGFAGGVTRH